METGFQIGILACCYGLLFLLSLWTWKRRSEGLLSVILFNGNWQLLHLRHTGGALIMAVIPALFLRNLPHHVLGWSDPISAIKFLLLSMTSAVLLATGIKHRDYLPPETSCDKSSSRQAIIHIVARSTFLISYEWFFRGIVLFACVYWYGTVPAIVINLVLYALIHSFNGKKEFFGSIPFGLVLCAFTLWFQTVWPAVVLHLVLSFSYESFLLSHFLKRSKIVL